MNVNLYVIEDYENEPLSGSKKTNPIKPKTNPIKACPELVPKVRSRMGRMDPWLNIIEFSESSVLGVYSRC